MRRMFESRIGELCRNGRTIYYTYIDGEEVESDCRDWLVRQLIRRETDRRFPHVKPW